MNFNLARENMIEQQIRTWEVLDPVVLQLLAEIPREEFIPDDYKNLALADTRIPIGHQQTTMAPKTEARILQALQISPEDRILEIGTGCGYLTALLATLGQHVTSIELFNDLSQSAANKLAQHDIENVEIIHNDVFKAMPLESSYEVIVLTASLPTQNDQFARALKTNGRLFSIIGQSPVMEALLIKRLSADSWQSESLFETDIEALIGSKNTPEFKL